MLFRRHALVVVFSTVPMLTPRHAGSGQLAGQPAVRSSAPARREAPRDTLFEFLVGEWRVEASPRVSKLAALVHGVPRYSGFWRGQRSAEGVVDELRVTDAAGTTRLVLRFDRRYDPVTRTWRVREVERDGSARVGRPPVVTPGAITLPSADGTFRSRFVERTSTRFRYVREVSADGGRTWSEPVMSVIATRSPVPSHVSR